MKLTSVKQNWLIESGQRLDASYHLSDGVSTKRIIKEQCPYETVFLKDEALELYKGNIHKRVYVPSGANGLPFYTASDLFKANIDAEKFISKKYSAYIDELKIKKNWIFVTRSGTLGKVFLTNENYENKIGTDDLVRIKPKENKIKRGYMYAFLSSKYGYGLLTQSGYGGVVKHIEPHHLEYLKIPVFPKIKQTKINNLIIESSDLRVSANNLLKNAQKLISEGIDFKLSNTRAAISINSIKNSHLKRFEAECFSSEGIQIIQHIKTLKYSLLKDVSSEIYRPGIFKRHYVDKGLEFFGGGEIMKAIPQSDKKLSIAKTKHLESLKIIEDQILVTCGGTIGHSTLVNRYLSGKTASQHILRINHNKIKVGYLFAFISSTLGFKAINSFSYGSVIPQIEPHHLELLPIPILEDSLMNKIHDMIMSYKENISIAIEKEIEAINLVEKEIEEWQK